MNQSDVRDTRFSPLGFLSRANVNPGLVFAVIIITALMAFEMFNYSTTDFALRDLLGDLKFAGIRWATILTIAFCGIDFAGIARLFTPQQGADEPKEVWYLFGAWLLAATMNAILTWWGVSMAVVSHSVQSTAVMDPNTLTKVVPIFVAIMVWVIRILIIGSLSLAGERMMGIQKHRSTSTYRAPITGTGRVVTPTLTAAPAPRASVGRSMEARSQQPASFRSEPAMRPEGASRPSEPTYHSLSMSSPRPATPAPRPAARVNNDESTPRRF